MEDSRIECRRETIHSDLEGPIEDAIAILTEWSKTRANAHLVWDYEDGLELLWDHHVSDEEIAARKASHEAYELERERDALARDAKAFTDRGVPFPDQARLDELNAHPVLVERDAELRQRYEAYSLMNSTMHNMLRGIRRAP